MNELIGGLEQRLKKAAYDVLDFDIPLEYSLESAHIRGWLAEVAAFNVFLDLGFQPLDDFSRDSLHTWVRYGSNVMVYDDNQVPIAEFDGLGYVEGIPIFYQVKTGRINRYYRQFDTQYRLAKQIFGKKAFNFTLNISGVEDEKYEEFQRLSKKRARVVPMNITQQDLEQGEKYYRYIIASNYLYASNSNTNVPFKNVNSSLGHIPGSLSEVTSTKNKSPSLVKLNLSDSMNRRIA